MWKLKHIYHAWLDGIHAFAFGKLRKSMDLLHPLFYLNFSAFTLNVTSTPNTVGWGLCCLLDVSSVHIVLIKNSPFTRDKQRTISSTKRWCSDSKKILINWQLTSFAFSFPAHSHQLRSFIVASSVWDARHGVITPQQSNQCFSVWFVANHIVFPHQNHLSKFSPTFACQFHSS